MMNYIVALPKPKEVCPVCKEEHCQVRITRNAIPSRLEERERLAAKLDLRNRNQSAD